MARRILKFRLPVVGRIELRTADAPTFRAVDWQGDAPVCWLEAEPGEGVVSALEVAMTGAPVPAGGIYIGTAQLHAPSPFVVHVYRVEPS